VTWGHGATSAGFSLLEMLIATALLLVVLSGIFALVNPGQGTYAAQIETSDMQQRLRVGVDALRRDLLMAGAGTYTAGGIGSLLSVLAPILPHTVGVLVPGSPDNPDPSAITIMYVPPTAAQTTTGTDLSSETAELKVLAGPGCPVGDPLCGFRPAMRVLVFDGFGAHDVFTITSVTTSGVYVQHRDRRFTTPYAAGAHISEVVSRTYYLNATEHRIYVYDAHKSNLPVLNDVVDLRFDYFGEAAPPALRTGGLGPAAPATTYGPRPPAPGVDRPEDDWGAGENCAFMLAGAVQIGRLTDWSAGASPASLVPIPYTQLNDGPWCPGLTTGAGAPLPNRFDADLLRVRLVRVTLRVQVGSDALRGSNPATRLLFANPGRARRAEHLVPDQEIRFDVAPPNMNLGR
jgi:prepilin-type N-terminal cleavage/methylation domain-containing protein